MNKKKPQCTVTITCLTAWTMVLALSGCSSYQYKRAEASDVATIRLVNKSSSPLYTRESHRGDCTDSWPFNDDGSGIAPNASRSTPALPGTFFVIMPVGRVNSETSGTGIQIYSCAIPVGFTVEANGLYEVTYLDEGKGCAIQARWQKDGVWQSLHLATMKPKNRFSNPVSCEKAEG